jgi:hypothetical protein
MVGPKANTVSACEACKTEGVEVRNVMDEPRANIDWLGLVRSTHGEECFRSDIGLDARSIPLSLSETEGQDFFLDIPSHRTHRDWMG